MQIIKYEKMGNNKYKIYLENNLSFMLYENVIVDNNLLYKREIDEALNDELILENNLEEAYQQALGYLKVRLRSVKEIKDYLKRKGVDINSIDKVIKRLTHNNMLDDNAFAKAFINDKLNFSSSGPNKIKNDLIKLGVNKEIIDNNLNEVDEDITRDKINKIILKDIKSNRKYSGFMLRNKIYNHLVNLGYYQTDILKVLNNYDF